MKEIKLSPKISDHDMGYRIDQANKFLSKGEQVKVTMKYLGRVRYHLFSIENGKQIMEKFVSMCDGNPNSIRPVKNKDGVMTQYVATINPKKGIVKDGKKDSSRSRKEGK